METLATGSTTLLIAVPALSANPDSVESLTEEWMRLEARLADSSCGEDEALMAQQGAAMEAIIETPSASIAGLHAKLRVMVTWMGIMPGTCQ